MKLNLNQIIKFLDNQQYTFQLIGDPKNEYKICSIFKPEPNGFYFYEGEGEFNPIDSLILVDMNLNLGKDNTILLIEDNPQEVYYKLLDYFFRIKSTGVICKTAKIHSEARIGKNVQIDSFTVIGKCHIGDNSIIGSNSNVNENSVIGKNVFIDSNCSVGSTGMAWVWDKKGDRILLPQFGGVKIEDGCTIGANSVIVKGSLNENSIIGKRSVIAPGARLGHGTIIGEFVHLANNVVTGGNTIIGSHSFIGSSAVFRPKTKLHSHTTVGAGAVVTSDTSKENLTLIGVPSKEKPSKEVLFGVPKRIKKNYGKF